MADFTQTITNSVRCLGPDLTTKWGSTQPMIWGQSKWGEGSLTMQLSPEKAMSESLAFSGDLSSETLQDRGGYYYVFPKPAEDAEDRNLSSFTSQTQGSQTYTSLSVTSATWA